MIRFALLCLLAAACTGSDSMQAPDGPDMQTDAGNDANDIPFGAPCQVVADPSAECNGGVCFHFSQVTTSPGLCTFHCTMSTQCPSGSMGQKCTTMSVCRP